MPPLSTLPLLAAALLGSGAAVAADEKSSPGGRETLLRILMLVDKDRDGSLSTEEFRRVPVLHEVKKSKIEDLFFQVDTDLNGLLSQDELTQGWPKVMGLLKSARSVIDADTARDTKKLKKRLRQ